MAGSPDKLEEVLKLAGVGRKTATLFWRTLMGFPGLQWIPMYFGFPTGWAGQREKPPADGTGIDEGSAQGSLEPD